MTREQAELQRDVLLALGRVDRPLRVSEIQDETMSLHNDLVDAIRGLIDLELVDRDSFQDGAPAISLSFNGGFAVAELLEALS